MSDRSTEKVLVPYHILFVYYFFQNDILTKSLCIVKIFFSPGFYSLPHL